MTAPAPRAHWQSNWTFLLAAIGAAVGLGNVWRFPYIAGTEGGSAFVLIYLLAVLLVALPILIAELMIGKHGQSNPFRAMHQAASKAGAPTLWAIGGILGLLAGFLIVSFYSVIAGWTIHFAALAAVGDLSDPEVASTRLDALLADPAIMLMWHSLFMMVCAAIVARGLTKGIEAGVKWMMPALFVVLLVLVVYALVTGDPGRGLGFLFAFNAQDVSWTTVLTALGQAFFSISVGLGILMAYGSHLPPGTSVPKMALGVALADTGVALIAGMAIFPLVFGYGLDVAAGPGLVFVTLPLAFGEMVGGTFFGVVFFALLAVAALTSAIALLQALVLLASEEFGWSQARAAWGIAAVTWALGIVSVLAFNLWSDVRIFGDIPVIGGKDPQATIEFLATNVLVPIGAVLIGLFAGWVMPRAESEADFVGLPRFWYGAWRVLCRWIAPPAVLLIMVAAFTA